MALGLGPIHRSLDLLAIWAESQLRREPQLAEFSSRAELACFGPLPPLPPAPPLAGIWCAPSPRPLACDDQIVVHATPAGIGRRGTVLLVPPWKIARPGLVRGYRRLLARVGFDVWLVCPPHHLERAAPGTRSGEAFISLDLARFRATFEQFVVELRTCVALAAKRGPVGLIGLSLGGLIGAFAATSPERLDFVAVIAPAHLALTLAETGIGRRYRHLAALAGSALPDNSGIAEVLAPFDPGARAPTARNIFVAVGLHDRIVPAAGPLALARAWDVRPALYSRGHMSLLFFCRALRRDLVRFMSASVQSPCNPSVPRRGQNH